MFAQGAIISVCITGLVQGVCASSLRSGRRLYEYSLTERFSTAILVMRTYALYSKSRVVGTVLGLIAGVSNDTGLAIAILINSVL
jgi:hypothetical protein